MHVHPALWWSGFNTVAVAAALYYFSSPIAALWWLAVSGVIYGLIALNGVMRVEQKLTSQNEVRREPHFSEDEES
jgi:hypothetical protein